MTETRQGAGAAEGELLALCAFSCVPGMGAATLERVEAAFGSLEIALGAGSNVLLSRADDLRLAPGTQRFLAEAPDLERLGRWALSAAYAAGAKVLPRSDPSYPRLLAQVANAPAVLYVRGQLASAARRVAVVGARAADEAALRLARNLGEELAAAGVEVVSGGARGVDAAAHAGALWGRGTTLAVLGTGVDVPYPPEHGPLFDRIASDGGALVSQFPPGTASARQNFPRRNRTIAGLSHAIVVVRASIDSGALITANYALEEGRALFAVPGDPADELAAGPNHLIDAGVARAFAGTRELVESLDWSLIDEATPRPVAPRSSGSISARAAGVSRLEPELEGPSRELWAALDEGRPMHVDALADRVRLASHEALRWLTEMELKGLCRQRPGKYFLRRMPSSVNPNGSAGI